MPVADALAEVGGPGIEYVMAHEIRSFYDDIERNAQVYGYSLPRAVQATVVEWSISSGGQDDELRIEWAEQYIDAILEDRDPHGFWKEIKQIGDKKAEEGIWLDRYYSTGPPGMGFEEYGEFVKYRR